MNTRESFQTRVMRNIASLERERKFRWYTAFTFVVLCSVIGAGLFLYQTFRMSGQLAVFDMASLLFEDREILTEYLGDTAGTFVTEFPVHTFVASVLLVAFVVALYRLTWSMRRTMDLKRRELAKYEKKR